MERSEFLVQITASRQIAEDRWEVFHPAVKVTTETTIGEIYNWVKKINNNEEFTVIALPSI